MGSPRASQASGARGDSPGLLTQVTAPQAVILSDVDEVGPAVDQRSAGAQAHQADGARCAQIQARRRPRRRSRGRRPSGRGASQPSDLPCPLRRTRKSPTATSENPSDSSTPSNATWPQQRPRSSGVAQVRPGGASARRVPRGALSDREERQAAGDRRAVRRTQGDHPLARLDRCARVRAVADPAAGDGPPRRQQAKLVGAAIARPHRGPPGKKQNMLFCEGVTTVDWKDTALLRKFISDRGKIRARRVTGLTPSNRSRWPSHQERPRDGSAALPRTGQALTPTMDGTLHNRPPTSLRRTSRFRATRCARRLADGARLQSRGQRRSGRRFARHARGSSRAVCATPRSLLALTHSRCHHPGELAERRTEGSVVHAVLPPQKSGSA